MKKRGIFLLLSFAGLVAIGFFLFPELPTPNLPAGDLDRDITQKESENPSLPKQRLISARPEIGQTKKLSSSRIAKPDLAPHYRGEEEKEELAEERAEAEEEAREQAEEDAENLEYDEQEDEGEALEPEEKEALNQFLAQLTPENWRQTRAKLLSAYKDRSITRKPYVENEFWSKVGEVGGQEVANELLNDSDPAYTKILGGWGKTDPQSLFDYFSKLDLKASKIQNYLDQTHNRELHFIDQFSSGLIDGLLDADKVEEMENDQLNNISEVVDYFVETDPMKGESLMREFTERVIQDRDLDGLKKWVSEQGEPELQAATVQRVIESGAFDEDPLEAVEFAHSLSSDKAKRTGLSSAYARLASGMNGHDPNLTAQELNAMQNGFDRDFALNGFAHGLVHSDPDAALQWANSISNDNFRKVVTKNISKRIKLERPEKKPDQQ